MKRLALLLPLLLAPAAFAQARGTLYADGGTGTAVQLNISGAQYATATISFSNTSDGGVEPAEVDTTSDGVNWIASGQGAPYVQCVTTVAANGFCATPGTTTKPAVNSAAFGGTGNAAVAFDLGTVSNSTWELPLAGNVVAVRVKAGATLTGAPAVNISSGRLYQPGVPVTATMFDVVSAANTILTTGIIQSGGWRNLLTQEVISAGAPYLHIYAVDDAGTNWPVATFGGSTANMIFGLGVGSVFLSSSTSAIANSLPLPRRINYSYDAAGVGNTTRLRVEASR